MASVKQFELEAVVRHDMGKGASRRLRREEKIPGVMYGGGKDAVSLTFEHNKTMKALENEAFYSHILTLRIAGTAERVILKDLQRHPYKPRLLHIDFQRVRSDEKIHMHVPLHFRGGEEAPGVKAGGVVSHIMSDIEIACFPDDLPEFLELTVADMQLNQIKHLSDIPLPKGVEIVSILHDNDKPVVSIHMLRIEEEPEVNDALESTTAPSDVPAMAQKSEADIAKEDDKKKK